MNTEVNSELLTLKAKDPDSSSSMIMYSIRNVTYYKVGTCDNFCSTITFTNVIRLSLLIFSKVNHILNGKKGKANVVRLLLILEVVQRTAHKAL